MTSAHYVREVQYRTDANLRARQSIYVYQQPRVNLHNLSLDRAELAGDESVLDVGCGNGAYLATLARREHRGFVAGLDMSAGMLDAAQTHSSVPLMIGDAQALPVRDASFDVVLAMHMLYHAPDRALAISELRRVMRDGGVTLVVTNSDTHLQEIDEIVHAAAGVSLPSLTFRLENGEAELRGSFSTVERYDMPSELVVTDVEPVVDYVGSMRAFVTSEDRLAPVLDEVRRRVAEAIERDGALRVHTHAGCFVCHA